MHIGIGAAIVIVAVIYFMIISPGFRKFVFATALLGGAAIGLMIFSVTRQSANQSTTTQFANSAPIARTIPASDLKIRDTELKHSYGDQWNLRGTVVNDNPEQTLSSLTFKVLMRDCPTPDACITIGENWASSYLSDGVPPRQARAFSANVTFGSLPKATKLIWTYELTAAKTR